MAGQPTDRVRVDSNEGGPVRDQAGALVAWNFALTTTGSQRDIQRLGIILRPGALMRVWIGDVDDAGRCDPLLGEGTVFYDEETNGWAVRVPAEDFGNASERGLDA